MISYISVRQKCLYAGQILPRRLACRRICDSLYNRAWFHHAHEAVTEWSSIIEKVLKEAQGQGSNTLGLWVLAITATIPGRRKGQGKRKYELASHGRDRLLEGSLLQGMARSKIVDRSDLELPLKLANFRFLQCTSSCNSRVWRRPGTYTEIFWDFFWFEIYRFFEFL